MKQCCLTSKWRGVAKSEKYIHSFLQYDERLPKCVTVGFRDITIPSPFVREIILELKVSFLNNRDLIDEMKSGKIFQKKDLMAIEKKYNI